MNSNLTTKWNKCLEIIRDNVSKATFNTLFADIEPLKYEDNTLTIQVKSNFVYEVADAGGVQLTSQEISVYSDDFMLMWPHSQSDFGNAQIKVEYNYQEPGGPLNTNGETVVDMQNMSDWTAGRKNIVGLMFKDKEIELTCKVEPWNVIEEAIDFTDPENEELNNRYY